MRLSSDRPLSPLPVFLVTWRVVPGGDIAEQLWRAPTRKAALARWSRFWGLRQRDCAEFAAAPFAGDPNEFFPPA